MLEQNGDGEPLWESLWPFLSVFDVIRVCVTAKSFHDAKKYGRHAELFFLPQNMRREADPIEPRHVSTERAIFSFRFTRLADMRLPARNDPLCQEALEELPWLCGWPWWPGGRHRVFLRAEGLYAPENRSWTQKKAIRHDLG